MTADSLGSPVAAFAFSAQSSAGESVTGTINAGSAADASRKLADLNLRVLELDPTRSTIPPKRRPLGADDFQAFNTQLAYLATAGLPIEKSLRLIAVDMQTGALAKAIGEVATDLESGRTLPEAFAKHASQFPPLYSELVAAGIRTGNLPGMLLGLGRHLEMIQRLRGTLWRAVSYPLMVLVSLLLVICFLGMFVLPQFKMIFSEFRVELPTITQVALDFSDMLLTDWPILLTLLILVIFGPPVLLRMIRRPTLRQHIVEMLLFPWPVVGPALKQNLLARWCDALKLGVEAGMDLPTSITMAGQAVGSPRLINDGAMIVETLNAGLPLNEHVRTWLIPPTVIAVLALASASNDLPAGLTTLSTMFQQQADAKMEIIPSLLTPALVILLAFIIGLVVLAMFAPMIALISSVSGPFK